jgi:hypothetical protein
LNNRQSSPTIDLEPEDLRIRAANRRRKKGSRFPVLSRGPNEPSFSSLSHKVSSVFVHARVTIHKDLRLHDLLPNRESVNQDLQFLERMQMENREKAVEPSELMKFLQNVRSDSARRRMVPRLLEITAGVLRKKLGPTDKELVVMHKVSDLDDHARLIRAAPNRQELERLTSYDVIVKKLEDILAVAA